MKNIFIKNLIKLNLFYLKFINKFIFLYIYIIVFFLNSFKYYINDKNDKKLLNIIMKNYDKLDNNFF